ncbi:pentatricopeptide repeat-containing protein At3g24000, mitochondrial [Cryptomeria japonica]|uniref:pentatricopeptide repeat-containing protein At3g24000, mitochondrial n=1 Tax=Cryptomeria japonica TaxID=3369 RepID=UPI0027D9E7EC|nr:pentatricopeptide repeat-containing protein At3g24000, mitochondrial [Cryptomeria japonica]
MVLKPVLRTKTTTLFHTHFQRYNYNYAMPTPSIVNLNFSISELCRKGRLKEALHILLTTYHSTVDSSTYLQLLQTCISKKALSEGKKIHSHISERHLKLATIKVLQDTLVRMYDQCGSLVDAREVFDQITERDVLSWNAIIAAYRRHGYPQEALKLFCEMQATGVQPDQFSISSIFQACAKIRDLETGMKIHQSIMERGFLSDVVVASALVDMYAKCGSIQIARELFDKIHQRNIISWNAMLAAYAQDGELDEALKLFEEMPRRDVVSWTAMVSGYAQNGFFEKALETFKQMQLAGVKPVSATYASILPACGKLGALKQGMDIHQSIIENGFLSDVVVVSAVVDMYAKCGSIHMARQLFDKMSRRNLISWNAMIAGYAVNGFCKDALELFELMKLSGTYPNHVTLTCVLLACSHSGLVNEACKYFNGFTDSYRIAPTIDHYVCLVDLLGRAAYLEQTLKFIIKMPVKPMTVVWTCLLGACRAHKNAGLGAFTATLLLELDPKNAATFVLLSNIYAEVGMWDEVQKVRTSMKDGGIKKIPGCSWIEDHKKVHAFYIGDRSHPQTQEIYAKLDNLSLEMKAAGYLPHSKDALNDVEEEEKNIFLCHHSEKLAIAFGLLNTPPGTTIRVVKNLRVCVDCHSATKYISKIVGREIVVRDANRFHHFEQGQCSCKDYW